jgi:iron(III) transport system substrate-binding protein
MWSRPRISIVLGIVAALAAVACAPAAAPRPTADGPGTAAASSRATSDRAVAWSQVVELAKREGRISIMGPPGADARDALAGEFQQRYPEIQVDFTGGSGSQLAPKLLLERDAGLYQVDVYIGGTSTVLSDLMAGSAVDPLTPFLVGPEVDPSAWLGGKLEFADDAGQYNLVYSAYRNRPFAYDPAVVPANQIQSWKEILDPRLKGKIAMLDPRVPGPALDIATFWYTTDGLGKDFIRQLFEQQGVVLTRDASQLLNWIARKEYAIAIGASDSLGTELQRKGVPLQFMDSSNLREGGFLASGFGSVAVVNRAPHPNAVKLYLNWLVSKEAQTAWSKASGYASRRLDVPTEHLEPATVARPGVAYRESYKEPYVRIKDELQEFLRVLIPS